MLPADLSHSPLLGIFAVIMGAGIASLAARLLSLGLADLRGHLGIGVDEGAWIGTAFNAATMFIGPLTVYLGALLGARRVLLVCSGVFAIVSACLPFAHSYSLLIVLLAIAGLSSGTFYPLTISFALLNVPLRYLALTLGVYATCIEGALNFAPSLYGFYRDHLSWAWMFWTSAVVAPVMVACVYLRHSGVPAAGVIGTETELRRIPVRQRRPRAAVRRARPGTAARLVAVGRVHGARSRQERFFLSVCDRPTHARAKPAGRSAVPAQMEHDRPGDSGCSRSGSCCWRRPWSYRSRCRSEVSTPRSSVLPCCGRRCRRCSWRSSRPTC